MNRRAFIFTCLSSLIAAPSLLRALSSPAPKRAFLHHTEYATSNIFQLDDLNTLFVRWRRAYKDASYTTLKLGRFEDKQFGDLCWSVSYTREGAERRMRMTERERYIDSPMYWGEQWKKGNRYLPWQRPIGLPQPCIEIVDAEHWCELT